MTFPNKKELERARKKLANAEGVNTLSENASKTDRLKYELCKQFVIHLRENNLSQKELATKLGIEPARLNEIIHYKIERFTVDRFLDYAELLNPEIQVIVA